MMEQENNFNRKNNWKKIGKRAGAIVLSAALFGGTAAGVFQGVNYYLEPAKETVQSAQENTDNEPTVQQVAATTPSGEENLGGVSQVAENVMPSVVAITNKSVQEMQNYFSMFGMGGQTQEQEVESSGSGIIVGQNEEELLIVTNNHVVEGADTLSVGFIDNQVYEAKIKGTDPDNDLAVIAVSLSDISEDTMSQIKVANVGNSDELQVGEQVVAIGNALGYGQSVTTGIVSALNRKIDSSETSPELIQTDAAINPGNSGGALLNMSGEVIGINSAKFASTEVEGMGYAIPISTASPIMEDLMNRTTRDKVSEDQASYLGIGGKDVSSEIEEAYGIPQGVYVASVEEGGAADQAGITEKSVIVAFDGTKVSSMTDLKAQMEYYAAGEQVTVTLQVPANNGEYEEKEVTVTLGSASQANSGEENRNSSQLARGQEEESLWNYFQK